LFLIACSPVNKPAGEVLARVGDRVITVEDFMRRAEYSLRPEYCSGEGPIPRKIILNSLIAEKILALEAQGQSRLDSNQAFLNYLQGREEQAMRLWLYKTDALDPVSIDTVMQRLAFQKAQRTFRVAYYQLGDTSNAAGFRKAIEDGFSFESIYAALSGRDSLPVREFDWFAREDPVVHRALFTGEPVQGEILGPLVTASGEILVMQVLGSTDRPALTASEISQRWRDVGERLRESAAQARYVHQVEQIMQGHSMELNQAVFLPYAERAGEQYLQTAEEKRALLNQSIWDLEEHLETSPVPGGLPFDKAAILFSVDGQPWSIRQFEETLQRHPLVFRKRNMGRSEFAEQLKLAIADMIRDLEVTRVARERGLDQVPAVKQYRNQFRDYYLAREYRDQLLDRRGLDLDPAVRSEIAALETVLDPLIDSLQQVYSDQIRINVDLFNSLQLTHVPLLASQQGVPFPLLVPPFPRLTTDHRLDYGHRMEDL